MINSFTSLFDPVLPAEVIDLTLSLEIKSFTGTILDAQLSLHASSGVVFQDSNDIYLYLLFGDESSV